MIFKMVEIKNTFSVSPSGNSFLSHISSERRFMLFSVQPISCYSKPAPHCLKTTPSQMSRRITVMFRLNPTGFIASTLADILASSLQCSSVRGSMQLLTPFLNTGRSLCAISIWLAQRIFLWIPSFLLYCSLWHFFFFGHCSLSNPYFFSSAVGPLQQYFSPYF